MSSRKTFYVHLHSPHRKAMKQLALLDPPPTMTQVAQRLGISRAWARQLAHKLQLSFRDGRRDR